MQCFSLELFNYMELDAIMGAGADSPVQTTFHMSRAWTQDTFGNFSRIAFSLVTRVNMVVILSVTRAGAAGISTQNESQEVTTKRMLGTQMSKRKWPNSLSISNRTVIRLKLPKKKVIRVSCVTEFFFFFFNRETATYTQIIFILFCSFVFQH